MARSLAERFEEKVDRTGEHHVWLGATNQARGPGRLKVAGRDMTAHRVAWELEHGDAPAAPAVDPTELVDALRSLAELRDQGVLTEAEFAAQKARLLG